MANLHVDRGIITTTFNSKGQRTSELDPMPLDPTDTTFPRVVDALGGEDAFEALPILDLDGNGIGTTGYIDNVPASVMSAPVMRGVDGYGRPFISFLLKGSCRRAHRRRGDYVETIFRRYRSGSVWTSGGGSFFTASQLTSAGLDRIRRVQAGELVGESGFCSLRTLELELEECRNWDEAQWVAFLERSEKYRGAHHVVLDTDPGYPTISFERGSVTL